MYFQSWYNRFQYFVQYVLTVDGSRRLNIEYWSVVFGFYGSLKQNLCVCVWCLYLWAILRSGGVQVCEKPTFTRTLVMAATSGRLDGGGFTSFFIHLKPRGCLGLMAPDPLSDYLCTSPPRPPPCPPFLPVYPLTPPLSSENQGPLCRPGLSRPGLCRSGLCRPGLCVPGPSCDVFMQHQCQTSWNMNYVMLCLKYNDHFMFKTFRRDFICELSNTGWSLTFIILQGVRSECFQTYVTIYYIAISKIIINFYWNKPTSNKKIYWKCVLQ